MDAQVPRNNAVQRVTSRRPYRPRQSYPGQPSQNDVIKELARQMCADIIQKEEQRRKLQEAVRGEKAAPKRVKRTRHNFQSAIPRPMTENGNQSTGKLITVRDMVHMMPVNCGAVVVCNPSKAVCRFRPKKEEEKEKIETVAKPRNSTLCHTLILTNEFDQPNDLDKLLDQFQK